jgi:hypothetical protein
VHLSDETTSGHALPAKKAASLLVVGGMFGEAVRWKAIHLALMPTSWLLSVLRGSGLPLAILLVTSLVWRCKGKQRRERFCCKKCRDLGE